MRLSPGLALVLLLAALAGLALVPKRPDGVAGRVVADDGPAAGATVRVRGTSFATRTDRDGRFRLPGLAAGRHVTAWKEGHFIAGARPGSGLLTLRLRRLPAEDDEGYAWVDPAPNAEEVHNCGNCHAEIYREWSRGGHARAADGLHFRNLYDGTDAHGRPGVGWGLLTQYPDGAGVCASCHAPTATDYDLRNVKGVASRGVHCDYCHKIAGLADGEIGLTHGRFNLRLLRPSQGQLFFGPLDDVDRGDDAHSPLYHDSRYCASCHEGVVFGVHVYSTYSEWLASPARRAGLQCQDCHMKPTGRMSNFAPGHGGIDRDPRTLANHRFFDGGRAAMLRRAVRASADFERRSGEVRARVRLSAEEVGHRVPTGFIDRHLVLIAEGEDAAGRPLAPIAGPTLPAAAGAELSGRPGRLYARLLADFDGRRPTPFWLAAPDLPPDTRLVPGRPDEMTFVFPPTLSRLRLRVLYRRFWPEVIRSKGWPDRDLVVSEQIVAPPKALAP